VKVYRSSKPKWAKDLSGFGSYCAGGRWNSKGWSALYAAESPALAMLETLVHLNLARLPSDMCLTTIEVPDKASVTHVLEKDLPKGWSDDPGPDDVREIGDKWLREGNTLLLRIPSAVSPHEFNYLINPAHREMARVKVVRVEPAKVYVRLAKDSRGKAKP